MKDVFRYDNPSDSENTLEVARGVNFLSVRVSDEQAVDSYNSTFECEIQLPLDQARLLRDYLNELPLG